MKPPPWHIFDAIGIELEYMIVDRETLAVVPIADQLLTAAAGELLSEVERGPVAWSNELVLHVLELKTNGPAESPFAVPDFQAEIRAANELAAAHGACLLPTAAHPWMNPASETVLWPHDYSAIYEAFDRIFGCQGHGWSNLQSHHLNLPFVGDEEFGRLHAALRVLLPMLPALAASSPILDGQATGQLDSRLEVYRQNCRRIPEVTARVVPEPVFTAGMYDSQIFQPMYRAIAPHDPDGILQEEWLNARGIIARFERGSCELRVLDLQECPAADLAIAGAIWTLLQQLSYEDDLASRLQRDWPVPPLEAIFLACVEDGDRALIRDPRYLQLFGWPERGACQARELWQHLIESRLPAEPWTQPLHHIVRHGPLARRILKAAGANPHRERLGDVYRELAACLADGRLFTP